MPADGLMGSTGHLGYFPTLEKMLKYCKHSVGRLNVEAAWFQNENKPGLKFEFYHLLAAWPGATSYSFKGLVCIKYDMNYALISLLLGLKDMVQVTCLKYSLVDNVWCHEESPGKTQQPVLAVEP